MGYPLIHLDQEKYNDPLAFNPWRWKVNNLIIYFTLFYSFTTLIILSTTYLKYIMCSKFISKNINIDTRVKT